MSFKHMEKFDDFLDKMKGLLDNARKNGHIVVRVEDIENTFPELKESEDERIRQALIYHFQGDGCICTNEYRIDYKDIYAWLEKQDYTFEIKKGHWYKCVCDYMLNSSDLMFKNDRLYYCRRDWRLIGEIDERNVKDIGVNGYKSFFRPATNQEIKDWLEKQGETKHSDKIESKFHEGDWIIFNGLTLYVREVVRGFYRTISKGGITNSYDWDIDNVARLWTIQDAKDCDILVSGEDKRPFIFRGLIDKLHPDNPVAYCGIDTENEFTIPTDNGWWTDEKVQPATKEQRDQLVKAITEEMSKRKYPLNSLNMRVHRQASEKIADERC